MSIFKIDILYISYRVMACNRAAYAEIGYTWDCRPRYRVKSKTEKSSAS